MTTILISASLLLLVKGQGETINQAGAEIKILLSLANLKLNLTGDIWWCLCGSAQQQFATPIKYYNIKIYDMLLFLHHCCVSHGSIALYKTNILVAVHTTQNLHRYYGKKLYILKLKQLENILTLTISLSKFPSFIFSVRYQNHLTDFQN